MCVVWMNSFSGMLDDLEWAIGELKKGRTSVRGDWETYESLICVRLRPIVESISSFELVDLPDANSSETRMKLIAKTFKVLAALVKQVSFCLTIYVESCRPYQYF